MIIQIGPKEPVNYYLVKTNAPKAADGSNVVDIYDGGTVRYILVREDNMFWQRARNASGLWSFEETDEIDQLTLSDQLWERLLHPGASG